MKFKSILALFLAVALCFSAIPLQVFASEATYYVAGQAELCGSAWDCADANNQMTLVEDGIYEITYTAVPMGEYQFKVTNGTWNSNWGGNGPDGNYLLKVESECDVTIRFDSNAGNITVSGDGVIEEVILESYFVAGVPELCGSEWLADDPANQMVQNADGIYQITYTAVAVGEYQLKVTNGTWNACWGGNGPEGNYLLKVESECDVTIFFDSSTHTITASGDGVYEEIIVEAYFVAGVPELCGSEWIADDPANQMVQNADGIYEITYTAVAAGEYQFKITNGTWDASWGGNGTGGNYPLTVETDCDVTILFDADTKTITVIGDGIPEQEVVEGFYVAGDAGLCGSEWMASDLNNLMTQTEEGIYEITYENVEAGVYEIKITDGTWLKTWGGENGNYVVAVPKAGNVTIRFDSVNETISADVPVADTRVIYFDTAYEGWDEVNVYYWGGISTVEWPGVAMTLVEGSATTWFCEIPVDATMIIFNNSQKQTEDMTIPTDGKNCCNGVQWTVYGASFGDISGSLSDTVSWTLADGVLTISGTGAMPDYSDEVAPWHSYYMGIHTVVIGNGITRVGDEAFNGMTYVTKVVLSDTVTSIGNKAFSNCAMTGVALPSSLTTLESFAFFNCKRLAEVNIPKALNQADAPFMGCDSLKTVTFEAGITKIADNLFLSCYGLESIVIPDTVTTIGVGAFYECTALASVKLSNNLKTIGYNAFAECSALESIHIPKSLTTVNVENYASRGAFEFCENLKTVTFEEGMTAIPASLFAYCDGLESIVIPNSVQVIGKYAFYMAENLKSVTLPQGLTVIPEGAFEGCHGLENIQGMESVTKISDSAFKDCSALKQITLPGGLTTIGASAFADCTALEAIQIPASVTSAGYYCFSGCTALKNVKLQGVTTVSVAMFAQCTALTSVVIPDSVTSIDNDAFAGCTALAEVKLSENLEHIGSNAFNGCTSLVKIDIPASVNDLQDRAFAGCVSMNAVNFGGTGISYLPDEVFADCSALTQITLPLGLESVFAGVFLNCDALVQVIVPNSVTFINSTALPGSDITLYSHDSDYLETFADENGYTYVETDHIYNAATLPPTCTDEGVITNTCGICGEVAVQSIPANGHSYENGTCTVCGTAVVVPTLTLKYPSLSFEDEILYNVYYGINNTTSVVEMGLIIFEEKLADGTIADAKQVIPGFVNSGSTYMVQSKGIPAKNLSDAVYFKVYAKLDDGTYVYTDVAGYNAVAYANTVLGKSSSTAKAKALVVSMLNYGAAAQEYFGYKTDALMNAALTAEQQALVSAYSDSMVADVVKADSSKVGSFVMNGGYSNIYPTVSFEGAFSINFYFTPNKTVDDVVTFYYWDAKTYNSVDVLTTENAIGVITMAQSGKNWGTAVEGIAAKAIDETVYVAAIYTSNGVEYPTGIVSYSLGNYCKTLAAKGEAFGAATAVYGYYAKAYFA